MALDVNRPDLTVGVVGTGAMGRGIAQVTAQGGIKAILFDAAAGGAAKARAAILETLKGLVAGMADHLARRRSRAPTLIIVQLFDLLTQQAKRLAAHSLTI